jgi:hypothetical protein
MPYRQNFPIPSEIDPPRQCLQICIPSSPEWKAVFAGLLSELTHWFNYERTGNNSGAQCAAVWKEIYNQIDWSDMSCCGCPDPIPVQFRYTADGQLERSVDGGDTWDAAPQYDPRVYSPTFPPLSGDDGNDKKCAAATGAVNLIKEQVGDQLTDDMSRYTLTQLITDWVGTLIDTANPLQALLQVAANQIFALVIALLRPALTDDVYLDLQCILYCQMADDASFDVASWQTVRSQIQSKIAGIAGVFLEHLVYLLGEKGLTNLVRSGASSTGDCSSCGDCNDCETLVVSPPGTGVISYRGDCVYRLSSFVDGGQHSVYAWFNNTTGVFDANKCGVIIAIEQVSGGLDGRAYNDCVTGTLHNPVLSVVGHCMSQLYLYSNAPFEVDITVAPC